MIMHPNARTTPLVRAEICARVRRGEPVAAVAERFSISRTTVYKWCRRGVDELHDRRSRPVHSPGRTSASLEAVVTELRRSRRLYAWQIAHGLGLARSTVIRILARFGLQRLSRIDPPPIYQRYEFAEAGDLVHIDIKKLGRIERAGHRIHGDRRRRVDGAGWEYVYVCVDDATRLAFLEVRSGETAHEAVAFLRGALRWFRARKITVGRVMTDNGKVFLSRPFHDEMVLAKVKHHRTPPYTPRVNGKAERFIRTMLGECAYATAFDHSDERRAALAAWTRFYNEGRPHSALKYRTPAARASLL